MDSLEQLRQEIFAQSPTGEQREAIFSEEPEFLLRAAPGSGKTWTSCRRFIWRAANWSHPVGGLALLSFTNTAINEFKTATIDVGRRDLLSDPNYVGTFDSFVERYILAPFGHLLTGADKRPKLFPGPRPGDWNNRRLMVWKDGANGWKVSVPAWEIVPYPEGTKLRFKTSKSSDVQWTSKPFPSIYKLLSIGFYTHAQRIFWACKLLNEKPHIAALLARRFPEIIVDEAQDTNAWLLFLLNTLHEKGAKITLIGDPDQCIYEFSMAEATTLPNLKNKWSIPEKPLSQSFRCNNQIASAARNLVCNSSFTGYGEAIHSLCKAYVVRETSKEWSDSISVLRSLAEHSDIGMDSAAILARGHGQLKKLQGETNFTSLEGKAKTMAEAAFLRDAEYDYHGASKKVEGVLRELTGDDPLWQTIDDSPDSRECQSLKLSIWQFVKNKKRLPTVSIIGEEWVQTVRDQLKALIKEIGLNCTKSVNRSITTKGLKGKKSLPLFEPTRNSIAIRTDTIHKAKGESIDSVLVIGDSKFWNSVMRAVEEGANTEARRVAYVGMTRARHLLVVGLPKGHCDRYKEKWIGWGFKEAPSWAYEEK